MMLLRRNQRSVNRAAARVSLSCPGCKQRAIMDLIGGTDQDPQFHSSEEDKNYAAGLRLCPGDECRTLVFVIYSEAGNGITVLAMYPAERIDFDDSGLPDPVREALSEAVLCHANECYVASAMMIRKTLEELCRDQGAKGDNLKARLSKLTETIVLPAPFIEALDALRLLGNDAAHVESRDYEQIGKQEVEVGLDVAKEILKATYQLDSIVARLTSLQRQAEPQ